MSMEYLKTLQSALDKIEGAFTPPPARNWYGSHAELAYLASAMNAEGYDSDKIVDMLEKPWKWTAEYEYAQKHSGSLDGFEDAADSTASDAAMDDVPAELDEYDLRDPNDTVPSAARGGV